MPLCQGLGCHRGNYTRARDTGGAGSDRTLICTRAQRGRSENFIMCMEDVVIMFGLQGPEVQQELFKTKETEIFRIFNSSMKISHICVCVCIHTNMYRLLTQCSFLLLDYMTNITVRAKTVDIQRQQYDVCDKSRNLFFFFLPFNQLSLVSNCYLFFKNF